MSYSTTTTLSGSYDPRLVALSVVIASVAAYVALTLGERVTQNRGRARYLWLLGGAAAMGSGIWSMHFIGMLAFHLPLPISYDAATVGVSFLAAIAASGVALFVVSRRAMGLRAWLAGGLLMGGGVGAMHYIGMDAMRLDAMARWTPWIVGLSVLVAIGVSLVALGLVFHLRAVSAYRGEWRRYAAAIVMGLAIAGMHYTGMAAATFSHMSRSMSISKLHPSGYLVGEATLGGGAIIFITLLVLGLALGLAFIDRRFANQAQALAESRAHFRTVVANAPIVLLALDAAGMITLSEGSGLAALHRQPGEAVGCSIFDLYADVPELIAQARRALAGEDHTAPCLVRDVAFEVRWTPLTDTAGTPTGAIAVATDITERQRAEAALQHQALHDPLTDLPNRALLGEHLQQTLRGAERDGTAASFALLDLNRFKEVNDTLGHHAGDVLLQHVALRVQGALRASDIVARLGGDEFAVLLPGADAAAAIPVIQRILAALAAPCIIDGHSLDVGGSLGLAVYPAHGADAATMLRHADVAMYVAKRAGSGYAVYDAAHDRYSTTRLTLESDLRQAIEGDGLQLHYQPKVDLSNGRLYRVEALVRWCHPTLGQLPPDQFIPLAEQTGLITPLTHWVLQEALRQLQAWSRDGLDLGVAVNLSMRTLHDPTLPDTVAWLLQRYAIAPGRLTLEVTESSLMADPGQARLVLTRLAALGVSLSIDDFGTGYSSLGYLKHLPVDEIKIDKSFVLGMDSDVKDTAIVRSVSELSHNLGLRVVAEGVETAETWDALRALGCDAAQGYYVSRPLPADELERWLRIAPWAVA